MSQKLNGGGQERLSQVADLSFKNCNLGSKTAIFGPKQPYNPFKTAKRRETVGTLHVRLDFPCQRILCGPLTPPYVPETAKKAPRSPKFCADWLAAATNQE